MILSSADILSILGGSEIVRLSAKLSIVDGKPKLTGTEGVYVCVERFPKLDEFEATWTIYVEGDEDLELIVAEMKRLLPKVQVKPGLITEVTTTDFRSESTQRAPEAPKAQTAQVDLTQYEERFQALVEDVQDQMLLVTSGRAGKDGKDGYNGKDGRDGKDIDATETELFDLKDADQSILPMEKGQVLTWDGSKWTNLYVRQVMSAGGPVGSTEQAPVQVIGTTIRWRYHSTSHEIEPDRRDFHADNASGDLVTVFHVSDYNSSDNEVQALVRELLSTGYSRLYVSSANDPSQAHLYQITSYNETASGFEIFVSHVETVGPEPVFVQPNNYDFLFLPPTASDLDVINIYQLIGVNQGDTDLGTFAGNLIPDNLSVKAALQSIETYIESQPPNLQATAYSFGNDQTPPSGNGKLEMDGATFGATTELYLNKINRDGKDLTNVIPEITQNGMRIYIQLDPSASQWVSFDQVGAVVDNGGYFTFNVTYVDSNDPADMFGNNAKITFGVFSAGTGGSGGIADAPADGNYYVRQNNAWVPTTSVPVDISSNTLGELSDVNVPTPSIGEALIYDGSQWSAGGDMIGGNF